MSGGYYINYTTAARAVGERYRNITVSPRKGFNAQELLSEPSSDEV